MGFGAMLSIIIVNYNTRELVRKCLASVFKFPPSLPFEVIVIDNASSDGSAAMIAAEFPMVDLVASQDNAGYGTAANMGVRRSKGEHVCMLNPDTEVTPGAFDCLLEFMSRTPCAGIVAPKLTYPDGSYQVSMYPFHSISRVLLEALRIHRLFPSGVRERVFRSTYSGHDRLTTTDWASGACLLIRRSLLDQIGHLTEETFCGADDYDICYRCWKSGSKAWFQPAAEIRHHVGAVVSETYKGADRVERLVVHNRYQVLSAHKGRVWIKAHQAAEVFCWATELIRASINPRYDDPTKNQQYRTLLRNRIRLFFRFLIGFERPIRRFHPATQISQHLPHTRLRVQATTQPK
jgi:GT2 family glycosyltransferase